MPAFRRLHVTVQIRLYLHPSVSRASASLETYSFRIVVEP